MTAWPSDHSLLWILHPDQTRIRSWVAFHREESRFSARGLGNLVVSGLPSDIKRMAAVQVRPSCTGTQQVLGGNLRHCYASAELGPSFYQLESMQTMEFAIGQQGCLPLSHCLAAEGSDMNTVPSS